MKDLLTPLRAQKGHLRRLAEHVKVHPSRLSRFVSGEEIPSAEQVYLIAQFMELNSKEVAYLSLLNQLDRASNPSFREHLEANLKELRDEIDKPASIREPLRPLTLSEEKLLHSSYQYMAVWLASMIDHSNRIEEIAQRLRLPLESVHRIADFLVSVGLCKAEDGRLLPTARRINVSNDSPWTLLFLNNWNLQAIERIGRLEDDSFFYSEPMAIGSAAYAEVKSLLKATVMQIREILARLPAERVACVNLSLFEL